MADYLQFHAELDSPYPRFESALLGPDFAEELSLVSRLWFRCGYRPGIAAYLNFFLLRDFIVTHDTAYPPRFQSFRSMAGSFYQTRAVFAEIYRRVRPALPRRLAARAAGRVLMRQAIGAPRQAVPVPTV